MRNALARTLYELAKSDPRIVVLVADISPAGAMEDFRREFPDRFINVGVAEQAMIGLAAGLAQRGFKPFCYTIAAFALFRCYEFIRCDLAYQNLPVTIVGMGAGLSYSTLGGTHQAIEDVAVAMACPNMIVLAPCDPAETAECARWCAGRESGGPVYLRIGKAGEPDLTSDLAVSKWHDAIKPLYTAIDRMGWASRRLILSYGPIAVEALKAGRKADIDVMALPSLRPVQPDSLQLLEVDYAEIITVEEASGGPLASYLRELMPSKKIRCIGLSREFPHAYGTREELLARAGLTAEAIIAGL